MSLIICPECGKQISDQSGMCIYCGYKFKKCPECNSIMPENAETCSVCGSVLRKNSDKGFVGVVNSYNDINNENLDTKSSFRNNSQPIQHVQDTESKSDDIDGLYSMPLQTWYKERPKEMKRIVLLNIISRCFILFVIGFMFPYGFCAINLIVAFESQNFNMLLNIQAMVDNYLGSKIVFLVGSISCMIIGSIVGSYNSLMSDMKMSKWLKEVNFNIDKAMPYLLSSSYPKYTIPGIRTYAQYGGHVNKLKHILESLFLVILNILLPFLLASIFEKYLSYKMGEWFTLLTGYTDNLPTIITISVILVVLLITSIIFSVFDSKKYKEFLEKKKAEMQNKSQSI